MSETARVPPTDPSGAEIDYVQILRGVLRRRKKIVIATLLVTALPLLAWAMYGQRPQYQSRATVQIKPSIAEMFAMTRKLPVGPNLSVQMAVLKSRALASEVLDALPQETLHELMNESLEPDYFLMLSNRVRRLLGKRPITTSPRERGVAELRRARMKFEALKSENRRGPTGLLRISSIAFNPRVATDLVNAYVQVLVNWSRRSEEEDIAATQKFLELQLSRVRRDVEVSEKALNKYEAKHGVLKLNEHTQFETSRLVQLQGQLAQIQANKAVAQRKLEALQKALKASLDDPASYAQVTADSPGKLRARLAQLESKLLQMRIKYTEQHPSVVALKDQIQNLRSQLASLPVDSMRGVEDLLSQEEILTGMAQVKAELASLHPKEQSLKLQTDQLRRSLQKLSGRELEYSRLRKGLESNRVLSALLSEKLLALQFRGQSQGGGVRIIDPANFPSSPMETLSLRVLAFLLVFSIGTAGGLGFLIEYIHEPVESEEAIPRQVDLPLLGSAVALHSPRSKIKPHPVIVFDEGHQAAIPRELYRAMRTNLEAANLRTPFKAIMISSASPGEGKSTTSVNLAMALRELGRRVILVDADLRHPSLSNLLQSDAEEGLANILQRAGNDGDMTASISVSLEAMGVRPGSDFIFIPSGVTAGDPGALLSSAQAKELVTSLKERCDYVLFDSPPLLLVSDNLLFTTSLDGVILVAKAGRTKKRDLRRAKALLQVAGARVLGVILNEVPPRRLPYYYYGRKYREYYTPRESNNKQ